MTYKKRLTEYLALTADKNATPNMREKARLKAYKAFQEEKTTPVGLGAYTILNTL